MPPKAKLTAVEKEAQKAAKAAQRAEERRLTSGEAALEHVVVRIDHDAWDDKYIAKLRASGVLEPHIIPAQLAASGAVEWTVSVHTAAADKPVACTTHRPRLAALVLKKQLSSKLKGNVAAYVRAACDALRCRVVVILEGAQCPEVSVLTHPDITSVVHCASPVKTGEALGALTAYVARAPYKAHVLAPKIFSEALPGLAFQRMLSHIPGFGPLAVAAVTAVYPTLAPLLAAYAAAPSADAGRALLETVSLPGGEGHVGRALSGSAYEAFVLGSMAAVP